MQRFNSILSFIVLGSIIVVIGGFLGWYYFLRSAQTQTNAQSAARNYGAEAPSFVGSTGSTYQNVASTLGASSGGVVSTSSRLWEVSQVPVAGYAWGSGGTNLYFVERSTGYELKTSTNDRHVVRLTDTLRPKTYEALIASDGSVVERSVDGAGTIITFAGVVTTTSGTSTHTMLSGIVLPQNIQGIAIDAISRTLYYAIDQQSGISLVSTDWTGKKEKHLFTSALKGWRFIAPGDGSLFLLQKPLDGNMGYAYKFQKDGSLTLLAQAPGLTFLPRASASSYIFGSSDSGSLALFTQQKPQMAAVQLPVQTIADKCAWSPTGSASSSLVYCGVPQHIPSQYYLDDWYKGIVHTSDRLYAVDVSSASSTLLYDPAGYTNVQFDIENPSVDPSGQFIAFINAADQSLWVLRIAQ